MLIKSKKISRFNIFLNFINKIIYKKNLVIFLGKNAVQIFAIKNKSIKKELFIDKNQMHDIKNYQKFLTKYKNYNICILIDSIESEINHEMIPGLQNILNASPIEQFISEKYKDTDIVAYNVYNISMESGEIWETNIAKTSYTSPLSTIIEYAISNSMLYHGSYFLSLEFEPIINFIFRKLEQTACNDDIQIFVFISKVSDIRMCVKHKRDIMDESYVEYPKDKSDEYLLGTIEQIVNDKIILFNDYRKSLGLKMCIIVLCDEDLKQIFYNAKFEGHKVISITPNDIDMPKNADNEFADRAIVSIFNERKTHIGFNNYLRSITKINFIHSIIFKPLLVIIFVLSLIILTLNFNAYNIKKEATKLNEQYFSLAKEYRKIKKRNPTIDNINTLAEFYATEKLLHQKFPFPFKIMQDAYAFHAQNIKITQIKWNIVGQKIDLNVDHKKINVFLNIEYHGKIDKFENAQVIIQNYVNYLRTIFSNFDVKFNIDRDRVVNLVHGIIVPAIVVITER